MQLRGCDLLVGMDPCNLPGLEGEKKRIGDHALPQGGFSLGTPKGAEGGGGNARQHGTRAATREAQATAHQASSKRISTNRHGRISNRSSNEKDIAGKNRAHRSVNRGRTCGQEAESIRSRIHQPWHAKAADSSRVNLNWFVILSAQKKNVRVGKPWIYRPPARCTAQVQAGCAVCPRSFGKLCTTLICKPHVWRS
jgi:hypothetical protein